MWLRAHELVHASLHVHKAATYGKAERSKVFRVQLQQHLAIDVVFAEAFFILVQLDLQVGTWWGLAGWLV